MEAATEAPKASQTATLRQLAVAGDPRKHLEFSVWIEPWKSHAMMQAHTYLHPRLGYTLYILTFLHSYSLTCVGTKCLKRPRWQINTKQNITSGSSTTQPNKHENVGGLCVYLVMAKCLFWVTRERR